MAVVFTIPSYLRPFTDNLGEVELDASPATVGEALRALWQVYPGVRDRVADERGEIRLHINVFVGAESIRHTGGLDTPLPSHRSDITIVPAVSGG